MNLSDLRVFQAVALTGGITRAAQVLHRVPSNVTTRVKNLEADLDVTLFSRQGNRLRLSPQGHVLLDYANRVLALIDEARDAMRSKRPRGVLRLGAMESTAAVRLPALLGMVHEFHPEISVELRTGPPRPMTASVLAGDLDAALVAEPVSDPRLDRALAYVEELVLIAPAGHPSIRTANDVRNAALLVFEPDCPHRQRFEAWCALQEMVPNRIVQVGSYNAILACCAAGMGVALIPAGVLATYSGTSRLSVHKLKGDYRTVKIFLIWRKGELQPKVNVLVQLLGQVNDRDPVEPVLFIAASRSPN